MSLELTQQEGLDKAYAHYLLFNKNSNVLVNVINSLGLDLNTYTPLLVRRNKEHINKALETFVIDGDYGNFGKIKYNELFAYRSVSDATKLSDDEQTKHAKNINLIHNTVIKHYPASGATTDPKHDAILNDARENLNKGLPYYGDIDRVVPKPETPHQSMDEMNTAIKQPKPLKHSFESSDVDLKPNHSSSDVDLKLALEVVATASQNPTHMVYGQINTVVSQPAKLDTSQPYAKPDKLDESKGPSNVDELCDWITTNTDDEPQQFIAEPQQLTVISDTLPSFKIIPTLGYNMSCLIHAFFTVLCESYRNLSTKKKVKIAEKYRSEIFVNLTTNQAMITRLQNKQMLMDDEADVFRKQLHINVLILSDYGGDTYKMQMYENADIDDYYVLHCVNNFHYSGVKIDDGYFIDTNAKVVLYYTLYQDGDAHPCKYDVGHTFDDGNEIIIQRSTENAPPKCATYDIYTITTREVRKVQSKYFDNKTQSADIRSIGELLSKLNLTKDQQEAYNTVFPSNTDLYTRLQDLGIITVKGGGFKRSLLKTKKRRGYNKRKTCRRKLSK